ATHYISIAPDQCGYQHKHKIDALVYRNIMHVPSPDFNLTHIGPGSGRREQIFGYRSKPLLVIDGKHRNGSPRPLKPVSRIVAKWYGHSTKADCKPRCGNEQRCSANR